MIRLKSGLNNPLEKFVLLAVFLFPINIILVPHGGSTIFGLVAIVSVFIFFSKSLKNKFSSEEKMLFYSCVFIFFIAMSTSFLSGFDMAAWKKIDGFFNFLLIVPLYFLFKKYFVKTNAIWYGLFIAVILCALVAVYEVNFGSLYNVQTFPGRAKASTHPILFGDMSLTMMSMLLVFLLMTKEWNKKVILLSAAVLLFGLTSVILSQSRGAWIVVPIMMVFILFQIKNRISLQTAVALMASFLLLMTASYFTPSTGVKQRIDSTVANVFKYSEGTNKGSSIGSRFEMWKASWMIFKEKPVVGIGWGNFNETAKVLVKEKRVSSSAAAYSHPHNQFISVAVNGGLLMLFALLVFIFVPLSLLKRLLVFDNQQVRVYTLAAMVLIISYMGYALSEAIFERSIPTAFYAFYLALFFALANRECSKQEMGNEL